MACCLKAFLRVLGVEDRRSVRTPHPNAVGLYDMSTIQTSTTVKRAKHVRLGGQEVADNQKTHNINDTKESITGDSESPRSRVAQQAKDGLNASWADKTTQHTMMPKFSLKKLFGRHCDIAVETATFQRRRILNHDK